MKNFEGKIISTGMTNTVVVEVLRVTPHPLYRKLVRTSKKYKVDTNGLSDLTVGSTVEITETKPMSKYKFFKVTKIVGASKTAKIEEAKKEDKKSEKAEISASQAQEATLKSEVKIEAKAKAKSKKATKKGSK